MNHIFQFVKNVKETGAIAPSSRFLVKDLIEHLKEYMQNAGEMFRPVRILELGPGTGVLTKEILKFIRPNDHFDVVELNRTFCSHLLRKYRHQNLTVHNENFLDFNGPQPYDFIFSSLPYESMPESLSYSIWQKKLELSKPDAYISYYKYFNFSKFKCDFEKELVNRYKAEKSFVLLNLPPAQCFTLKLEGAITPEEAKNAVIV